MRAYAYRSRLAETLPELESSLNSCMDYLQTETLIGYGWLVKRGPEGLHCEPAPDLDTRQLYLPHCESMELRKALEEEQKRKKEAHDAMLF